MPKLIATIVLVVVIIGTFVGLTKPGHQMLDRLGITSACDSSCD